MPVPETIEPWRFVWREGFAPLLPTAGLKALRKALKEDDSRLLQGATTMPPPLQCVATWPIEAACAVTFCGVVEMGGFKRGKEDRTATVAEAEEFFARACFECDKAMGEPAACRWLLNWWDESPRDFVRRELLPEVDRVLAERKVS